MAERQRELHRPRVLIDRDVLHRRRWRIIIVGQDSEYRSVTQARSQHRGAGRFGQNHGDVTRTVRLVQIVVQDRDLDRLLGLAGREGQRSAGSDKILAGRGGSSLRRRIVNRHFVDARGRQRGGERHLAGVLAENT